MADMNVGSVAGMSDVDKLAAETAKDTQANIDALYAAQVAIEAGTSNGAGDSVVSTENLSWNPATDAVKIADGLKSAGYNFEVEDIQRGLQIMKDAEINYSDGLDEAEKGQLNKILTEMTNDGKINEAMAKKVQELGDFMAQQLSRG